MLCNALKQFCALNVLRLIDQNQVERNSNQWSTGTKDSQINMSLLHPIKIKRKE